jgi:hypothetical protein
MMLLCPSVCMVTVIIIVGHSNKLYLYDFFIIFARMS